MLKSSFYKSPRFSIKQNHYFKIYEDIFEKYKNKSIVLVEIGVYQGGSLFMWRDYFGSAARIIGIEANPFAIELNEHGFEIYIGDQSDPEFWKKFFAEVGNIDILIDDGGHWNEQQIKTLCYCLPYINNGGTLVVEDTQTSFYNWMGNPSKYSFIEYIKYLVDVLHSRNSEMKDYKINDHKNYIYEIKIFNSIVAFIIDRKECYYTEPITNNSESMDYIAFGTDTTKYGQFLVNIKKIFLFKYFKLILNPFISNINILLLKFNNYKLKKFFK